MEVGYSSLGVTAHCVMAITSSYRHRRDYGHFGDQCPIHPLPFPLLPWIEAIEIAILTQKLASLRKSILLLACRDRAAKRLDVVKE